MLPAVIPEIVEFGQFCGHCHHRLFLPDMTESTRQESAASQALRIPHIVAATLHHLHYQQPWYKISEDTLLACTLVNTLFEEEANRLLWGKCDNKKYDTGPTLRHLAWIRPPSRVQKYANYIRKITISEYYNKDFDHETGQGESYLTHLNHVSFPLLESLILQMPDWDVTIYPLLSLNQFAQPGLRQLHIFLNNGNPFAISEEFLQRLQRQSTRIREIEISDPDPELEDPLFDQWKPSSPDTISSFLQAFPLLESLTCQISGLINKSAFKVLSRCTRLKTLKLFPIYHSWLSDTLSDSAFSALRDLRCEISSQSLNILVPFLVRIEVLSVYEYMADIYAMTSNVWKVFVNARFSHLRELRLNMDPTTVIRADELISVAHSSPQLQSLVLWPKREGEDNVFAGLIFDNVNDNTIRELAKQLPALTMLELGGYSETSFLSEDCLIALAQHCPLLTDFSTYASIDWVKLVKNTSPSDWPSLESLILFTHPIGSDNEGPVSDVRDLAQALLKRMPNLDRTGRGPQLQLRGAQALQQAVSELRFGI